MIRKIRRYGNRKLYDLEESRYITLAELGNLLRNGAEIEVSSHPTGLDITSETLANIVLSEVLEGRGYDRARMLELIRTSRGR